MSVQKEDWHRYPGVVKARGKCSRKKMVKDSFQENLPKCCRSGVGEVEVGGGAEPAGYLEGRAWEQMGL